MKTLSVALAIPAWIISLNMAGALDWTAEDEAQYIYHRQVLQKLSQQYQQIQQDEVDLQIKRRQDAMEQQIQQNRDDMQRQNRHKPFAGPNRPRLLGIGPTSPKGSILIAGETLI
jgi:hypothetical protein